MVGAGIDRAPTEEEKKSMKQLGDVTARELFLSELAAEDYKHAKLHMPFDGQNAKLDYKDMIEDAEKESERRWGYVRQEDIVGLEFGSLKKYGDAKRFTIVGEDEEVEAVIINGMKSHVKTGWTVKYIAARGFGVSVFYPTAVYDEKFPKGAYLD